MYWSGGIFKSILTASEWWTIQQQFHCHVLCWLTLSLSPNINIQILQTELYTFSLQNWSRKCDKRSSKHFPFGDNFIKSQNFFSWLCTDKCCEKMYRYYVGRKLHDGEIIAIIAGVFQALLLNWISLFGIILLEKKNQEKALTWDFTASHFNRASTAKTHLFLWLVICQHTNI